MRKKRDTTRLEAYRISNRNVRKLYGDEYVVIFVIIANTLSNPKLRKPKCPKKSVYH